MLTASDFGDFFAALNGGHRPFAWQVRLLESLIADGKWPEGISAPTGTGKSSVVDIHVFANALAAVGASPRVPRRLSVVVNRRAIVDQHQLHAIEIQRALVAADRVPVVEAVRQALGRLAGHDSRGDESSPLAVVSLRGGQPLSIDGSAPTRADGRAWLDDPSRCAVICATPDMWGSRALFRGYGTALLARPRAAGLLALDSAVIIDEAHLSRQLVITARDIAQHVRAGADLMGVPGLQVVSSTATPSDLAPGAHVIGVEEADVIGERREPVLHRRLVGSKSVDVREATAQPQGGKASAAYVKSIALCAMELREHVLNSKASGSVGVVVNHVSTAARVADQLRTTHGLRVALWVGRLRPMDLDALAAEYPGIFTIEGCSSVDVLVTTQTAEVGVDIDFPALVTELAPAAAMAQRFGRVNRRGKFQGVKIHVLVPAGEPARDRPPYLVADLREGYTWLQQLAARGGDASPWALWGPDGVGVPSSAPSRLAWSRVRPSDVDLLAGTSVRMFQEPDLAFWLRDDLAEGLENVSIVVRDLPQDDALASALVSATLPSDREMLPVPIGQARAALARIITEGGEFHARVFTVSSEDGSVTPLRDLDFLGSWLKPGATAVIDASHALFVEGVLDDADQGNLSTLAPLASHPTYRVLQGVDAASLMESDEAEQTERATQIMGAPASVAWSALDGPDDGWVVIKLTSDIVKDETIRQIWSPSGAVVLLADHCQAVAERALQFGRAVGLAKPFARALEKAGLLHDAGKADLRFQRCVLANDDAGVLLAKGRPTTPWEARRRRAGMPPRWRHEQLSAAIAWSELKQTADPDRSLVVRLTGTSHGWGRPFFPHGAEGLAGHSSNGTHASASTEVFDGVCWQNVLDETRALLGEWGCAYLEAIMRAADGTVSGEGR